MTQVKITKGQKEYKEAVASATIYMINQKRLSDMKCAFKDKNYETGCENLLQEAIEILEARAKTLKDDLFKTLTSYPKIPSKKMQNSIMELADVLSEGVIELADMGKEEKEALENVLAKVA